MEIFLSATEFWRRNKSHKFSRIEFVRLVAAAKFSCGDKTFHNNSPILYTRSDLSLRAT